MKLALCLIFFLAENARGSIIILNTQCITNYVLYH